ncbi:nucleotidyltransferase domain-containing protein [Cohnella thailandensis]|uniref:Nucleotidyltransferase domain-containing protein n=1 Tax=Cohnella thailandensis TaxID=557557 RepID=A0A841SXB2_9BACL|nr:nucleotidyltransferase domain-containing protein [Cohnella thailandensis]MBB6636883.1 nucleotidyltransferase domain-containing protein [Cohnella thailandensis]MBP1973237.1 putative nucleotidyltransferase [Cohnella thailandensis]
MNIQATIANIVDALKGVDGVNAVVLGGSRARGTESPSSDIDIGVYYDSGKGLDIARLRQVASSLDDDRRDGLITEIGGWGPWINGGGWLKVNGTPVDFLLRDQNKASQVIERCVAGDITVDYQPGHPHGFVNSIYMAEIALCKALWDPSGVIGNLKSRTTPYPPVYQKAVIGKFLWEAAFSLENGYKGIYKNDLSYIAGCCFRSSSCLNQVLFAANESYLMNEKGAAAIVDTFRLAPIGYADRVNDLFSLISEDPDSLKKAFDMMRDLIRETETILVSIGLSN